MKRLFPLFFLMACGAQQDTGGKVFCQSYEDNYLSSCQAHCESEMEEVANPDAIEKCNKTCQADLADDDTYVDSCTK